MASVSKTRTLLRTESKLPILIEDKEVEEESPVGMIELREGIIGKSLATKEESKVLIEVSFKKQISSTVVAVSPSPVVTGV